MQRRELSEEEESLIEQYSEDNKYLKQVLTECWETGINTNACCGGHRDNHSMPYIGITIDDNSMVAIKKMLGTLQDVDGVLIRSDIRRRFNTLTKQDETFPEPECKVLYIYGRNYNRCEIFAKMLEGLKSKEEKELNDRYSRLYKSIEDLKNAKYQDVDKYVREGILLNSNTVNNVSTDLVEYNSKNSWREKLKRLPIIRKILETFSPRIREENRRHDELKEKYEQFQEEYQLEEPISPEPTLRDRIHIDITKNEEDLELAKGEQIEEKAIAKEESIENEK